LDENVKIIPVEEIPDQERVARHIDEPFSYNDVEKVIWKQAFMFPGGKGESACWEKYAPTPEAIHAIGKVREADNRAKGKNMTYVGYVISTSVGSIRQIKTQNGHGFTVTHEPAEGIHHCEIRYSLAAPYGDLKKTDKADLKTAIEKCFGKDLIACDP
jgi:hypothetical protein